MRCWRWLKEWWTGGGSWIYVFIQIKGALLIEESFKNDKGVLLNWNQKKRIKGELM